MEKLGLVISVASGGKSDPFSVNVSPSWSRLVIDLREELKSFSGIDGNTKLTRLSFIETGVLITTMSPISGRNGDYKSAWIYIPATASIRGLEMAQILDFTRAELNGSRINEDRLISYFSKEYPSLSASFIKQIPVKSGIAYRYYGGDTYIELFELLGEKLYQPYYLNYSAIYFVDKETNPSASCSGVNLTDKKVKDIIVIDPPKTCDGFIPFLNETVFSAPITLAEGEKITIKWVKDQYQPIEKTWSASKQTQIPSPSVNEYKRKVLYSSISVCGQCGQAVHDYVLRVNGNTLREGECLSIPDAKIRECEVVISAEGFYEFKGLLDLSAPTRVKLRNVRYTYTYKIPLEYCKQKYGEFTLESDESLKDVPFKGYRIDYEEILDKGKYDVYVTPANQKKEKFLLFAGIALLISLLLGLTGGMLLSNLFDKKIETPVGKTDEFKKQNAGKSNSKDTEVEIGSVIEYLDSHSKWNRAEMEKFKDIQGLWDALNERRFDDILKYKQQLHESTTFNKLVEAIEENKHKTFLGSFNSKPDDYDITIGSKEKGYIKKLYDAQESGHNTVSSRTGNSGRSSTNAPTDDQQNNW